MVGYRGSGKSTVGRLLAQRLGWTFADSDDEVEASAGKSIAAIFADDGEHAFREQEELTVATLCGSAKTVVALGGGAVLRQATRERLATAGPVVWLTASAAALAERINADEATAARRPSLTRLSGLEEVEHVLAEREPIYRECATVSIDAEGREPAAIAEEIARWLTE